MPDLKLHQKDVAYETVRGTVLGALIYTGAHVTFQFLKGRKLNFDKSFIGVTAGVATIWGVMALVDTLNQNKQFEQINEEAISHIKRIEQAKAAAPSSNSR